MILPLQTMDQQQELQKPNVTSDQLVRGPAPENIEQRCLDLCKSYIGGFWTNANVSDITVTRISGGCTNQLFRVQLNDSVPRTDNEFYPEDPEVGSTDVAIKLYLPKLMKHEGRLDDIIITTVLGESDIAPKLYGLFNDGSIHAYVKHEFFGTKHQKDPKLVKALAQLLARIHNLNVPLRKNDTWPISEIDKMLQTGYNYPETQELIEKLNLTELKQRSLQDEFEEIKGYVKKVNSPLVFSHNDFIGTNILVSEPNQKLLAIDFEYSTYFARGYDFAVYHAQWGIEPYDYYNMNLPEDSVLENFIRLYIEAMESHQPGYSKKPENSVEKILREVKVYTLVYLFKMISFVFQQREPVIDAIPVDPETNMKTVNEGFKLIKHIKQRLIKDGTLRF